MKSIDRSKILEK